MGQSAEKVWLVIPAAGVGKRMQATIPKQYLKINDKTIIEHTVDCFTKHPDITGIVVAVDSEDPFWNHLNINTFKIPLYTVEGGAERYESVNRALEYLALVEGVDENNWIMVHDAARPCLSQEDLNKLLELRNSNSVGGILAIPVRDTMKRTGKTNNTIVKTEVRDGLWHALTPQLFRLGVLRKALEHCLKKGLIVTDESSAIEAMGEFPEVVEGRSSNIKVTRPEDLEYVSWILSQGSDHG